MKAIVIEKPGAVALREVPDPQPGDGDVLLQPMAGGICGTDVHILEGNFLGRYPVIPCHEFSAQVVAVGASVEGLEAGDRVSVDPNLRCGHCVHCRSGAVNLCSAYEAVGVTLPGGFAGLVAVPARNVYPFRGLTYSEAAFAEPLACVLYGQSRLTVPEGADVLLFGAGAIGLLHLQICAGVRGASVVVVDRDPGRHALARRFGAREVIGGSEDPEQELRRLQPEGWDVIIEATGSGTALQAAFGHLRRGGQMLVFGVYPREDLLRLSSFDLFVNDWTIRGSFTYRHEFAEALQLMSSGRVDVRSLVNRQIALEEVPETLRRLAAHEKTGKVHVAMEPRSL